MRTIFTKYLPQTDHRQSRVVVTDGDNRTVINYDDTNGRDSAYDNAALTHCARLNWTGYLVRGDHKNGRVYVFLEYDARELIAGRLPLDGIICAPRADNPLPDGPIEAMASTDTEVKTICRACNGTGELDRKPCRYCRSCEII